MGGIITVIIIMVTVYAFFKGINVGTRKLVDRLIENGKRNEYEAKRRGKYNR